MRWLGMGIVMGHFLLWCECSEGGWGGVGGLGLLGSLLSSVQRQRLTWVSEVGEAFVGCWGGLV